MPPNKNATISFSSESGVADLFVCWKMVDRIRWPAYLAARCSNEIVGLAHQAVRNNPEANHDLK